MAILQNRRTVFSLSNSEVMSNSAPTTEAGITKSEGHDGFFIYSGKAFTLWFKDQGGSWSSFNTYNLVDLDDGVAFSWGDNTAAFVQTSEVSHSIAVFVIETKQVGQYKNVENKNLSEAGFNRLDVHSNYKRVRMQNSGHTGEAYAIAIFDENGDASYVSAPPSGQREGKALGWDENGELGWVTLAVVSNLATSSNLEESYLDSNGVTQPVKQYGTSLSLVDGVYVDQHKNDYVYGDFSDDLRPIDVTEKFSFSAFYKFLDSSNGTLHLFRARSGSGWGLSVVKVNDTTARIFVSYNGTGVYLDTGNTVTTSLNQFHHIVMTSDNGTMKLYHDGTEVYSNNSKPFAPGTPNDNLYKIADGSNGTIKAEIDQVNVYKGIALSLEQVASMTTYSTNYTAPPADPNAIADIQTFGNTSISNDVITLNGEGNYAIYTGDFKHSDQHSVSFWFKTVSSSLMAILSCHVSGYYQTGYNGFWFRINNGTLLVRALDVDAGENNVGTGLNDGQWHHVVLTYQAGTTGGRKMYLDGVEKISANGGVSNIFATEFPLFIGANPHDSVPRFWPYTGDFYGLQVTNTIMTAQEVTNDYINNNPTPGYTPPDPNSVPSPQLYFDGSSTSTQIGTNSFSLGGAVLSTSKGKYGSDSFDFGSTGNKNPMLLSSGINLGSGVYTFSLWFYNKRTVNNWGSVIRSTNGSYPIITKYPDTDELGNFTGGSFAGTGFFMTQFEGLQEWTHLAVVANGTTSTYYVNGQQAGTTVNRVITSVANQFGSMSGGPIQTFAEALDEIAYWDSALTATQIETIYNSSDKLGDII